MTEPAPTRPETSRLARWLTEIFVIALGILLAFSVDATWSRVQEAEQERLTLEALVEEFRANVASLRETGAAHDVVARACSEILALTGPTASDANGIARLIGEVWIPWHAELNSGAIQSLLSTENLARIRDPRLRAALAGWPDRVASLERLEEGLHARLTVDLIPAIQSAVPQVDLELVNGFATSPRLREEFETLVEPSRFEMDFGPLLRSMRFENTIVDRMTVSMIARQETYDLADEAERILGLLEESLGAGST